MFSFFKDDARTEPLRQAARSLGMKFEEKDEYHLIALLRDFELFNKGSNKKITNILSKSIEVLEEKVTIFDYAYTEEGNDYNETISQTVFFVQSKKLAMPEMLMKPEHFFNRVGQWLGIQQDIDFEEYPVFSASYLLQGPDEPRIRKTMHNEHVLRFFTIEREWHLESVGFFMILYLAKKTITPDQIKFLFNKGMSLYELFKTEEL